MNTFDSDIAEVLEKSNPKGYNQYTGPGGSGASSADHHSNMRRHHEFKSAQYHAKEPMRARHEAAAKAHMKAAQAARKHPGSAYARDTAAYATGLSRDLGS